MEVALLAGVAVWWVGLQFVRLRLLKILGCDVWEILAVRSQVPGGALFVRRARVRLLAGVLRVKMLLQRQWIEMKVECLFQK